MLKFVEKRTAWWPFTLHVRGEDGAAAAADIQLKFVLPNSLEAIGIEVPDQIDPATLTNMAALRESLNATVEAQIERLAALIVDWRGVSDESGTRALAYSPDLMRKLLLWPEVPQQVMAALVECLKVRPAEKNFDAPAPGGPAVAAAETAI